VCAPGRACVVVRVQCSNASKANEVRTYYVCLVPCYGRRTTVSARVDGVGVMEVSAVNSTFIASVLGLNASAVSGVRVTIASDASSNSTIEGTSGGAGGTLVFAIASPGEGGYGLTTESLVGVLSALDSMLFSNVVIQRSPSR
jgi:hypothetical protein